MNKDEIIKYWLDGSESDLDLCKSLFDNKRYS